MRKQQDIEKKHMPKKSITQIGQELDDKSDQQKEPELQSETRYMHIPNKSLTKIGQDNDEIEKEEPNRQDQTMPIPTYTEEGKDLGKPPLGQHTIFTPKNKKDNILESQFNQAKKTKFTV